MPTYRANGGAIRARATAMGIAPSTYAIAGHCGLSRGVLGAVLAGREPSPRTMAALSLHLMAGTDVLFDLLPDDGDEDGADEGDGGRAA